MQYMHTAFLSPLVDMQPGTTSQTNIDASYFYDFLGLVSSLGGIVFICALIVIAAIIAWIKFKSKADAIYKDLEGAIRELSKYNGEAQFAAELDVFEEYIINNQTLCHAWSEFQETIIRPQDQNDVIQNVHECSQYFNIESIINEKVDIEQYRAISGYLTGFGILGTFAGLVAGIFLAQNGLAMPNPGDRNDALGQLLHGASLAFLSSLIGLSSSIVYSWFRNRLIYKVSNKIANFCNNLDSKMTRISVEHISNNALNYVREQTAEIKKFNTDMAVSIGTAMDKSLTDNLKPTLEQLVHIMEDVRNSRESATQEMLEGIVTKFQEGLSSFAGTEMRSIAETLNTLHSSLSGIAGTLGSGMDYLKTATTEASDKIRAALEEGADLLHERTSRLLDIVVGRFEQISSQLNQSLISAGREAGQEIRVASQELGENLKLLSESSLNLKATLVDMSDSIDDINQEIEGSIDQMKEINKASISINETSSSMKEAAEEVTKMLGKIVTLSDAVESASQNIKHSMNVVSSTWEEQGARFDKLDTTLSGAFSVLVGGIENYQERVREFHKELDEKLSKALQLLSGAIESLGDEIEEFRSLAGTLQSREAAN